MVSCKNLVLLVAIGLAVAVSVATATNLISGRRQPGYDYLACVGQVDLRAQYNTVVKAERACSVPYGYTINYIYAQDRGYYGRGGYGQISRGGVGQRNVSVLLWSQRSQPLNFTISVYARPGYANLNAIPMN